MLRVRDRNGIYAGFFLTATAAIFLWQGWDLPAGTLGEMGPGYFPNALCGLQILLGLAVLVGGFVEDGAAPEILRARPLVFVLASVCFFGLTIERLGLPLSLIGLVMIAGLAQKDARHLHNLALAILIAVACALIFVKGLGLQMSIWPAGMVLP